MDAYTHEKEQIDQIKKWWKENWLFLVGGLVIAIGGVSGWKAWQAYELDRAEAASAQFDEMLVQLTAGDTEKAGDIYQALKGEYGKSVYALMAALKQAEQRVESGDLDAAAAELAWAKDSGIDRELQLLATLRLARVQLETGDTAAALATIDGVGKAGRYESALQELKGDIHYREGNVDAARAAYEAALAAQVDGATDTRVLQLKIDNLDMPVEAVVVAADAEVQE